MITSLLSCCQSSTLEGLMGWAWPHLVWPTDPGLAERATTFGFTATLEGLSAGHAWIISVDPQSRVSSLWQLRPEEATSDLDRATFVRHARAALELAQALSLRDVSAVASFRDAFAPSSWSARPILLGRGSDPTTLDGPSFGLAMCLARASLLLDRPLPAGLLATAEITYHGALAPIGFLKEKVDALVHDALGVTELMVAEKQADEARTLLAARSEELAGRVVKVVGVTSLRDAYAHVFPDVANALVRRWGDDPALAAILLRDLFRAAVLNRLQLMRWKAVHETAEILARRYPSPSELFPQAETVRKIALRHMGGSGVLLEWPEEASLRSIPRPLRLQHLANVVQSAADEPGATQRAAEYVLRALPFAGHRGERGVPELRLCGAIGRAMAVSGPLAYAARWLEAVVEEWFEIDEAAECSRAFGAWCHVTRSDDAPEPSVDGLLRWISAAEADPRTGLISKAFMRTDAAAMLLERGWAELALRLLDPTGDEPWVPSRAPVRLRLLARAYEALGDRAEASRHRADLAELARVDDDACVQQRLAGVDEAIAARNPAGADAAIEVLVASTDAETKLVLASLGASPDAAPLTLDDARRFVRAYRY